MEKLSFDQVLEKIKKIKFDEFDIVIAIGRGGIVPGSLIANYLKLDFDVMWLNFRDDKHCPRHDKPKLVKEFNLNLAGKKILLVDDVSRTGATLKKAKELLKGAKVKTLVVNGSKSNADYSLFNYEECVEFPWN